MNLIESSLKVTERYYPTLSQIFTGTVIWWVSLFVWINVGATVHMIFRWLRGVSVYTGRYVTVGPYKRRIPERRENR
jgi:hypothetical protein